MIKSFNDDETKKIYDGYFSTKLPSDIQNICRSKLLMIDAAITINDLRIPPGNHLEKLLGAWDGYYSIRINDQYRIMFKFNIGEANNVSITDYH